MKKGGHKHTCFTGLILIVYDDQALWAEAAFSPEY